MFIYRSITLAPRKNLNLRWSNHRVFLVKEHRQIHSFWAQCDQFADINYDRLLSVVENLTIKHVVNYRIHETGVHSSSVNFEWAQRYAHMKRMHTKVKFTDLSVWWFLNWVESCCYLSLLRSFKKWKRSKIWVWHLV